MVKFEPYRIIINANDEDDILYEKWYNNGKDQDKKPRDLDKMETRSRSDGSRQQIEQDRLYEKVIEQQLTKIAGYRTGKIVLAASRKLRQDLYILPPGFRDQIIGGNDPFEEAELRRCRGAAPKAFPATRLRPNSRVLYMPYVVGGGCKQEDRDKIDDSVLVHELVHAVRPDQFHELKNQPTKDKWSDLEEFFAVMVQNIYMSERGDEKVRGEHETSDKTIPATRAGSYYFMEDKTNYARVKQALKREPMARELAKLTDIPFNPFAEFERARHDLRSL